MQHILLCVDGEPHTVKAESYALELAQQSGAALTALYVVDPYLKKFTHEIYAVNRDECRAHLDRSLEQEGRTALDAFAARAQQARVPVTCRLEHGDPQTVISERVADDGYDLVVIGGKLLRGAWARFESRNLPERLFRSVAAPLLVVR